MNFAAGYVGDSSDLMKIRRFEKQREDRRKQIEELKKISSSPFVGTGTRQFLNSKCNLLEQKFDEEMAGLVTKAEFIRKRRSLEAKLQVQEDEYFEHADNKKINTSEKYCKNDVELSKSLLSFIGDEDEEDLDCKKFESHLISEKSAIEPICKRPKIMKNPDVDTTFLPDSEREREEKEEKERLAREWIDKQDKIKEELIDITYSYWDGSGHRKKITVRKGDTIGQFLSAAQKQLTHEFEELRNSSSSYLMYVREDIIVPHHFTFYELILNKETRKTGPLFDFCVKEDLSIQHDASKERRESHAGKVVERHWYEKNKHIFPASKWDIYDISKKWENCKSSNQSHIMKN
jgi:protein FAM50